MKTIIRNFLTVLRRFRMATILNILGLSVAFAAFMVIMMQVDYDRGFDTYHRDSQTIYRVEMRWEEGAPYQVIFSRPLANDFINFSPHIEAGSLTGAAPQEANFIVEQNGQQSSYFEQTISVYSSYTDVFHFDMVEGVADALKEPGKILMPESMARKMFGAESAIGKELKRGAAYGIIAVLSEYKEESYVVGGVYKDFPRNSIMNNLIYTKMDDQENLHHWGNSNYNLFVRLDSPEASETLIGEFMDYYRKNGLDKNMPWFKGEMGMRLTPLPDIHFTTDTMYDSTPKSSREVVWVLITIAFVILLIAGINFTNFSTALTPMRIKSINTQKVLGSSDGVLRFALMLEAISISLLAYFIALVIVHLADGSFLTKLVNADISLASHLLLVLTTGAIAIAVGFLAGLYPSWYITAFPPALVLKGTFSLSPKGRMLRNVLISVQFVASFSLVIGAMFMYLQNHYMSSTSLGFEKDAMIVTNMSQTLAKSKDVLENQLKSFSGIEEVSFAEVLLSSQDQYAGWGRSLNGEMVNFQCLAVDPSFLDVMRIQVQEGRGFRQEDELTTNGVFIFNQQAKEAYQIKLGDKIDGSEIIGFIPDIKFASFRTEVTPMAFYVWGQSKFMPTHSTYSYIRVKAGTDLHAAMHHVEETLDAIDPDFPFMARFFEEVLNSTYEKEKNLSALITLFSLIAVFISIVGVFGLAVFESQYKRKEIGLRKVLGSTTANILIMFNKVYLRILLICFVLSAPVSYYAVSHWLKSFAYKTPLHWWVFAISFLTVSIITMITITFQNWRAANENPVHSIKSE